MCIRDRARFHQIFYAALSLPLPHLAPAVDGASEDNVLVLSRPIAPEVHIVKADTSASLLSPHHLKDLLQVVLLHMPLPLHMHLVYVMLSLCRAQSSYSY